MGSDSTAVKRSSEVLHRTDCVCTATRRAARSVTQFYDLVLAPARLKATQFMLLQAIAVHGEIAQFMLSKEYAIAVETLSRRLSAMRKAGWVKVKIGGEKKEHIYSLTPEGARVLNDAMPYWLRAQQRLAFAFGSPAKLEEVVRMLDSIASGAVQAQSLRSKNCPNLDGFQE